MGMREMVILILGLVVVAIVLRGLYLALHARRGQIRLAIDRNIPQDVDLEALELSELPSGGARVVQRSLDEVNRQNSTQDELDLGCGAEQSGPIPILMDTVEVKEYEESLDENADEENLQFESELDSAGDEQIDSIFATESAESDQDGMDERKSETIEQNEVTTDDYNALLGETADSADSEFNFGDDGISRSEPTLDSEESFEDEFGDFPISAGDRIGDPDTENSTRQGAFNQAGRQKKPGARPSSFFRRIGRNSPESSGNSESEIEQSEIEAVASESSLDSNVASNQAPTRDSRPASVGGVTNISQAKEARKPATVSEVKTARPIEPAEVLVVNVMSQEGELFHGRELLQVLITTGLNHGDMDIFHKHVGHSSEDPVVFSVASILNPGTFDLDDMDSFSTRGVSLFLSLPAAIGNLEAFEQMLKTAQQIRSALKGELKDDHRNVMTSQTIEYYRQRIHNFELRRLKATQARS